MPDGLTAHQVAAMRAARAELERRRTLSQKKEDCEQSLASFIKAFWHVCEPETPLVWGWVMDLLCDILMAVTDGHLRKVIINVPPGFCKSLILCCYWPAWEWGPQNMGHQRYICTSYSQGLTVRDNGRVARLMNDPIYRQCWGENVQLTHEGVERLQTDKTGWKLATSVGGRLTGERGSRVIIDDGNDPNKVESETIRGAAIRWAREIMPNRLGDLSRDVIINLQQRTHEDDISGTLIKHGQDYATFIVPMEFDPLLFRQTVMRRNERGEPIEIWSDPRGLDDDGNILDGLYVDERDGKYKTRMGSPMAKAQNTLAWPERFPPDVTYRLKSMMDSYAWSGQYQQVPSPRGGGIIRRDWWRDWRAPEYPPTGTRFASLDTAFKEGQDNDFNALTVWGAFAGPQGEPRLIMLDAWRLKAPLAELVTKVGTTCQKWKVDYLLIEDAARGHDTAAEINLQYERKTWETLLLPVPSGMNKTQRLHAVSAMFSGTFRTDAHSGVDIWTGGMIYAPVDRSWADEVIDEVCNFPNAAHDDYVDGISQFLLFVRKNGVVVTREEWEYEEVERKQYKREPGVPYANI